MILFEKLGKDVAAALKPGPGERSGRQLAALIAIDWQRRRRTRQVRWIVAVAGATVVLAVLWMNGWMKKSWTDDRVLEVAGDRALEEGRWLQVTDGRPLKLVFADGTEFRLERQSTSRLSLSSGAEARLILEAGELSARVKPAALTGRSWAFHAGPYQVLVIGTDLYVSWSAQANRLSVHVGHGRARVRGGPLEPDGMLLGSGDRLEVQHGRIEIHRGAESNRDAFATPPAPSAAQRSDTRAPAGEATRDSEQLKAQPPGTREAAPPGASAKEPVGSAASASDDWKSLARAGDYRQSLVSAERDGFDALIERLNAADLALLADAARLGGDSRRARQALLTLRRRFPGVGAAHTGAFRLGRLALSDRNYAEAAKWFEAYLQAAPSGALAAEAAGRLIEARARAGNRAGAEAAARDYLRRFSGGPYDTLARAVLRGDKLVPR